MNCLYMVMECTNKSHTPTRPRCCHSCPIANICPNHVHCFSPLAQSKGQGHLPASGSRIRMGFLYSTLHHHSGIPHGPIAALFLLSPGCLATPSQVRPYLHAFEGSLVQANVIILPDLRRPTGTFPRPLNHSGWSKISRFSSRYHPTGTFRVSIALSR